MAWSASFVVVAVCVTPRYREVYVYHGAPRRLGRGRRVRGRVELCVRDGSDGVLVPGLMFPSGLQWQVLVLLDVRQLRLWRRARRVAVVRRPVITYGVDPWALLE